MRSTSTTCMRPLSTVTDPGEPLRTQHDELSDLVATPWTLRVGKTPMIVRPSSARDLAAVAQMHSRCTPRSLLDRYRAGGRPPAVAALDHSLRAPFSVVVACPDGSVVAHGTLTRDRAHNHLCATIGLLVQDGWQRLGIGSELVAHLAGVAQVVGYHELIAYPATAVSAAQRLMIEVGRTRMVPDTDLHLHTYLPESATLGLGSVRQRLAG
ncbi:GNAT family N-acetyltransferase [uncultured Jatrophihabitans sp.]|uniref:GNAT family N-acetyltransferase n=1 Tax=uncultured Jatrophihabitans sp. TaxID=1610747 RepID=UPI0035CBE84C